MHNIRPTAALILLLVPLLATAQLPLEGLKQGAEKAAKAVGDTTKGAVTAVGQAAGTATGAVKETVDSAQESLGNEATPQETRDKLDAMAKKTLERLFTDQPDSQKLFERSAGYAVFDRREASFYVVAGYGRGVAVERETDEHTYMKMATTGAGVSFGLGGFASQLVILFESDALLQKFINQGLDGSAEIGTMTGEEKDQLRLGFDNGKAVFILTGKGWKIGAKLTGSRYWPDDSLNVE
ncbi:lipid-binding SYLF domain-containing protein [Thiorhodovibrio frisius]|uniref:Ysc84 actin-binding domain-containing protein n=1 Tax=Thiorhodovibrio frisius TaxID=631362 RepID=H8Z8C7_9GAMM|nr:hypothetical protein [Thiorhodovibrio frisius]EIC21076.1 hypothetical protein Thi970DRAFT_04761 [Thiorhodovibrio frisius]WPL22137.1 hypothetical protein Thiofri_02290 [Thiorhodovibrio frisius]